MRAQKPNYFFEHQNGVQDTGLTFQLLTTSSAHTSVQLGRETEDKSTCSSRSLLLHRLNRPLARFLFCFFLVRNRKWIANGLCQVMGDGRQSVLYDCKCVKWMEEKIIRVGCGQEWIEKGQRESSEGNVLYLGTVLHYTGIRMLQT